MHLRMIVALASVVGGPGLACAQAPQWPAKPVRIIVPFPAGGGVDYIGRTTNVVINDTHAAIYIDDTLIRHLELDRSRAYQPSDKKRGGPRRRLP